MNREIKFRGKPAHKRGDCWDSDWYYGFLIPASLCNRLNRFAICKAMISEWDDFLLYEVLTDTIGQFTGIHDKNGKEIFEGDIITFTKGKKKVDGIWVDDKEIRTVSYSEGSFSICGLSHVEDSLEIIGNIYDNPELTQAIV